jgi:hypothetical protein
MIDIEDGERVAFGNYSLRHRAARIPQTDQADRLHRLSIIEKST